MAPSGGTSAGEPLDSFLPPALEATADGLLIVDNEGRIRHYNSQFLDIWDLPEEVLQTHSDLEAAAYARDRLVNPDQFLEDIRKIYEQEEVERYDYLEFEDGRTVERFTRPILQDGKPVGRVWSFRDVTDQVEAVSRLEASEQRYRTLLEQNMAGVFYVTEDGDWLDCNEALASIFGYDSPEELMSEPASVLYFDSDERDEFLEDLRREGVLSNYELTLKRKDGQPVHVLENSQLLEDPETGARQIIGTLIDVSERKRLRDQLEAMAHHDELTGVANRRRLRERARQVLTLARRHGTQVGLAYIDLVSFKMVNDSLGHTAGDQVLTQIARQLQARARESDTVARVGGDEFVVLLPDVDGVEGVVAAADRLADTFQSTFMTEEQPVHLECRIGVALYPDHGADLDELLSNADRALTRARAQGQSFAFYEPGDHDGWRDELATAEGLRRAIRDDELELYYQPIVRLKDEHVVGLESLARWPQEDGSVLSAGQFLPTADRVGLTGEIDRWALRTAVAQLAQWQEAGFSQWIGVNLSARSFGEPDLADFVRELIDEGDVDCTKLVIEVTEQAALRDLDQTLRSMNSLRECGVCIAIDDFGTGYSALAHLKHYPADLLKIDMLFIRNVQEESMHADLGEAIVQLGHAIGAQVVAEGVEAEEQCRWLSSIGCDYAQGYHLGRPVPASEIEAQLTPV